MNKTASYVRKISESLIIAGIIIFLIGLYYSMFKAGIPYQDPPLELQIEYAVNSGIGDVLTKAGLITAAVGCIARVLIGKFVKPETN